MMIHFVVFQTNKMLVIYINQSVIPTKTFRNFSSSNAGLKSVTVRQENIYKAHVYFLVNTRCVFITHKKVEIPHRKGINT